MLRRVIQKVIAATARKQLPWDYELLPVALVLTRVPTSGLNDHPFARISSNSAYVYATGIGSTPRTNGGNAEVGTVPDADQHHPLNRSIISVDSTLLDLNRTWPKVPKESAPPSLSLVMVCRQSLLAAACASSKVKTRIEQSSGNL